MVVEVEKIKKNEGREFLNLGLDDIIFSPKVVVTTTIPAEVYRIIKKDTTLAQWIIERFLEWKKKVS